MWQSQHHFWTLSKSVPGNETEQLEEREVDEIFSQTWCEKSPQTTEYRWAGLHRTRLRGWVVRGERGQLTGPRATKPPSPMKYQFQKEGYPAAWGLARAGNRNASSPCLSEEDRKSRGLKRAAEGQSVLPTQQTLHSEGRLLLGACAGSSNHVQQDRKPWKLGGQAVQSKRRAANTASKSQASSTREGLRGMVLWEAEQCPHPSWDGEATLATMPSLQNRAAHPTHRDTTETQPSPTQ